MNISFSFRLVVVAIYINTMLTVCVDRLSGEKKMNVLNLFLFVSRFISIRFDSMCSSPFIFLKFSLYSRLTILCEIWKKKYCSRNRYRIIAFEVNTTLQMIRTNHISKRKFTKYMELHDILVSIRNLAKYFDFFGYHFVLRMRVPARKSEH